MCIICVEIIRGKMDVYDAKRQSSEAASSGSPIDPHLTEIFIAADKGDVAEVDKLLRAGYKKERWI